MVPSSRSSKSPAEFLPDRPSQADGGLPAPENHLYYPALNGLRAIAVLMVFTAHYLGLPAALNWGWTGVDLFFVLSGFLITGILFDSRHSLHRFRSFYIRRTLRIFPLYYLVLLGGVVLYAVFHWQLHPGLWLWPVYMGNYARLIWPPACASCAAVYEDLRPGSGHTAAFLYHLDHLWSLCVEEQFYLVWPFVVFVVRDRVRLRNLCIAVVVATPAIRLVCLHFAPKSLIDLGLLYRTTPLRADSLLLGGAMALALRGPERERVLKFAKPVAQALIALFAILEITSVARLGHFINAIYVVNHNAFGFSLLAVFAGAAVLLALNPESAVYRFCMLSPLRELGKRSYGFYVYHLLLFSAFRLLALLLCLGHKAYIDAATAVVALFGTIVISWISFRFFEAPLLRLKDRYAATGAESALK